MKSVRYGDWQRERGDQRVNLTPPLTSFPSVRYSSFIVRLAILIFSQRHSSSIDFESVVMNHHLPPDSTSPNFWIQSPLMQTHNLNSLISPHVRSDSSLHQDLDRETNSCLRLTPELFRPLLFTQNWASSINLDNSHRSIAVPNVSGHWKADEYRSACLEGEGSARNADEGKDLLSQSRVKQLFLCGSLPTPSTRVRLPHSQNLRLERFVPS